MKAKKQQKVPVTNRAVIQRINRRLKADDEVLKKARGAAAQGSLGDYYIVNVRYNAIGAGGTNVDPEKYARELGVLADYEVVEDEP